MKPKDRYGGRPKKDLEEEDKRKKKKKLNGIQTELK